MENSHPFSRRSTRHRLRIATASALCLALLASACSVRDDASDTVETIENEVAGLLTEAPDIASQSTSLGSDRSSALGFRLDPGLEASLSAVQVGIELDPEADEAASASDESGADDGTAGTGSGADAADPAETADTDPATSDPVANGEDAAAAPESSASDSDAGANPAGEAAESINLEDLPPGPGAGPVWVATAKDSTGYVQLYDAPNGTPITVNYEYLDGSLLDYQVWNPTFFGGTLALLVVGGDPEADDYVQVQLPVRPTGTKAWVATDQFEYFLNDHYVEIDVATNTVRAWNGTELILESAAVTGRPDRPTPLVRTYIDEKLPGPNAAYGPWMLTLAAFSESLNTFGGGLPKLAVHGTNQPGLMGQYASSGCIRLPNDVINQLAELVPVGTRVDIVSS